MSKFVGADLPKFYYECAPHGDDASLIAMIGRWLDAEGTERLISLAAFIATETMPDDEESADG